MEIMVPNAAIRQPDPGRQDSPDYSSMQSGQDKSECRRSNQALATAYFQKQILVEVAMHAPAILRIAGNDQMWRRPQSQPAGGHGEGAAPSTRYKRSGRIGTAVLAATRGRNGPSMGVVIRDVGGMRARKKTIVVRREFTMPVFSFQENSRPKSQWKRTAVNKQVLTTSYGASVSRRAPSAKGQRVCLPFGTASQDQGHRHFLPQFSVMIRPPVSPWLQCLEILARKPGAIRRSRRP